MLLAGILRPRALWAVLFFVVALHSAHAAGTGRAKGVARVDLGEIIDPLLSLKDFEKIFHGTLRNLDFSADCSAQCPVCYVDAKPLHSVFETDSVLRRLKSDSFRSLLAKNMRPGLKSDPMDHADIETLSMGLLRAIEGSLAFSTSMPPGSVERTKRLLRHWKVDVSMSGIDAISGDKERAREYLRRADAKKPSDSLLPEHQRFAIWLAYKPHSKQRVDRLLGGTIEQWGLGLGGGFSMVRGYHPRFVSVNDYHANYSVDLGRVAKGQGLRIVSPATHPPWFDCINFPHTMDTIGKGKFVVMPDGAFMVVNVRQAQSHTGKKFIRLTKDNYRELGMKHLIRDPNPVYAGDYRPNPHFKRSQTSPVPREAVLGFVRR